MNTLPDRNPTEETFEQNGGDGDPAVVIPRVEDHDREQPRYRELEIETVKLPVRVKFEPPIEYDREVYKELVLDFDSMTGKDFQRAEKEFVHLYQAGKNEMPLPEVKHLYHTIIAAHLANVPIGLIQKLPRRYYVPLRTECLKACGSSPDEEKPV